MVPVPVPVRRLFLFVGYPLMLLVMMLLSPAANSLLECTKLKLPDNKSYPNCTDLPSLGAFLHWNYHPSKNTLSIAYTATPPKPGGWIAWAINPTNTGMIGAQSLIAFPHSNGSVAADTYNLSSYKSIQQSKLSFDVRELSAVSQNGKMMIFATITLPNNMSTLNQVWQVGGVVSDGMPLKHDFAPANLNAKGPLALMTAMTNSTSGGGAAPAADSASNSTSGGGMDNSNNQSGGDKITGKNKFVFGILFSLLLAGIV